MMEMEVKRFEAPTLAEALKVIRQEFGPEAVVLSTKNKKSGVGLLNKKSVEVTAAISQEVLEKKRKAEERLTESQKARLRAEPASKATQAYDILSGSRLRREYQSAQSLQTPRTSSPAPSAQSTQQVVPRSIAQKRYIDIQDEDSPADIASTQTTDQVQLSTTRYALRQTTQTETSFSTAMRAEVGLLPRMISVLLEAGVNESFTRQIGDELKAQMVRDQVVRPDLVKIRLARILMSRIRVARPLGERLSVPSTPRVITFVGPTGVGKTTTIAKIAAELVINQAKSVTLATTDTFKIAAVEQLQAYANILRIPLEVCPYSESLKELSLRSSPHDIVLVDTPGFGPKEEGKLQELSEILGATRMETHLCVSALTRDRELQDIYRRYQVFQPNYVVVTKFDESGQFGNIFNAGARSQIPFSYFTMGQKVPEDMEVATKERLVDLMIDISEGV